MPELSEMIRDYVDAVVPRVSIDDIRALTEHDEVVALPGRRRRRARVTAVVVATAVAIALVATFLILPVGSPPSSATAVLNEAAMVAASRPRGPAPQSHQYLYYQVTQGSIAATPVSAGQTSVLYSSTETVNTWVASNGTGRQRITYAPDTVVLPSQRAQWNAAGGSVSPPSTSDTTYPKSFAPGNPALSPLVGGPLVHTTGDSYVLSYFDINALPTQPAALERNIERYYGVPRNDPSSVFFFAGDVLQVGASPAVRAALFKVVEHLRGVTLLGRTRDASGRVGVGVALSSPHIRRILVFDPQTSAVLGALTVTRGVTSVLGTVVPKGTLISFTTYGTTGVTSSITRLPGGTKVPLMPTGPPSGTGAGALYVPRR